MSIFSATKVPHTPTETRAPHTTISLSDYVKKNKLKRSDLLYLPIIDEESRKFVITIVPDIDEAGMPKKLYIGRRELKKHKAGWAVAFDSLRVKDVPFEPHTMEESSSAKKYVMRKLMTFESFFALEKNDELIF
jgi:hypothetical protein